jgi:flagellar basal body-associated protein FliL
VIGQPDRDPVVLTRDRTTRRGCLLWITIILAIMVIALAIALALT